MSAIRGKSPNGRKSRELAVRRLADDRVSLWIYNPPQKDQKGWEIIVAEEDLVRLGSDKNRSISIEEKKTHSATSRRESCLRCW